MGVGAANLEIFREPPLRKFREWLAVNVKTIGNRVTGRGRRKRAPLRKAADVKAGGIMRLPPFIHIENHIGINQNSHACFF